MENLNIDYNKEVLIRRALLRCQNKSDAARLLGITERSLYNHIDRYSIEV